MSHNLWRHYSAFDLDCGPTDSLMVEAVADIPLITGDETVDKTFPKIKSSFLPQESAREFNLSQKRLHHQLYIRHQQQHHQLYPQPNLLIWLAVLVTFFYHTDCGCTGNLWCGTNCSTANTASCSNSIWSDSFGCTNTGACYSRNSSWC